MKIVDGSSLGILSCPHCGEDVDFYTFGRKAFIVCKDKDCWGGMKVEWGSHDDPEPFIEKMKRNWNTRTPDGHALIKARAYIEKYRDRIYEESQKPYSDYCAYCVQVLDEVLNQLDVHVP